MRYKVEPLKQSKPPFVPFTVILTVETREEATFFHDKIMGRFIHAGSHDFFGAIYCAGQGDFGRDLHQGQFDIPDRD